MIISRHHLPILDEVQERLFQERIRAVFNPALQRLTWSPREGERSLERQLRGDLINALGSVAEDKACEQRARELYGQYEKDPISVERNSFRLWYRLSLIRGAARIMTSSTPGLRTLKPHRKRHVIFSLSEPSASRT